MIKYREIANAKLNLFLSVGDKNTITGRHVLESAYFPILIGDVIDVVIKECLRAKDSYFSCSIKIDGNISGELSDHLILQNRNPEVFLDFLKSEENLVSKTIRTFFNSDQYKKKNLENKYYEIEVLLFKQLPDKAGIGGGSSDAAAMLRILAKHFSIAQHDLYDLAESIGADVLPCFINLPSYFIASVGYLKRISSSDKLKQKHVLLAKPPIGSDTKSAFLKLNRPCENKIFNDPRGIKSLESISNYYQLEDQRQEESFIYYFNDFEDSVFQQIPDLYETKSILLKSGAEIALMTGSGSTIFGVFSDRESLENAMTEIDAKFSKTWWVAKTAFC